jgi:hypothetical protein
MDGDGLDAELPAGAQDAKRDLAAVGDDDLVEHSALLDGEEGLAELDRLAVLGEHRDDLPARSLSIWFIIFMASMMQSTWPTRTSWPTSTKALAPGEGEA